MDMRRDSPDQIEGRPPKPIFSPQRVIQARSHDALAPSPASRCHDGHARGAVARLPAVAAPVAPAWPDRDRSSMAYTFTAHRVICRRRRSRTAGRVGGGVITRSRRSSGRGAT